MNVTEKYAVLNTAVLCAVSDLYCYAGFETTPPRVAEVLREIADKLHYAEDRCEKGDREGRSAYENPPVGRGYRPSPLAATEGDDERFCEFCPADGGACLHHPKVLVPEGV